MRTDLVLAFVRYIFFSPFVPFAPADCAKASTKLFSPGFRVNLSISQFIYYCDVWDFDKMGYTMDVINHIDKLTVIRVK